MNSTYEVIENLYLGDAKSVSECYPEKIKCLVSLFQCDGVEKWSNGDLLKIKIDDLPTEDILQHFQPACDFIHSKLTNQEAVLVHCFAGSSRSVSGNGTIFPITSHVYYVMNMLCNGSFT